MLNSVIGKHLSIFQTVLVYKYVFCIVSFMNSKYRSSVSNENLVPKVDKRHTGFQRCSMRKKFNKF